MLLRDGNAKEFKETEIIGSKKLVCGREDKRRQGEKKQSGCEGKANDDKSTLIRRKCLAAAGPCNTADNLFSVAFVSPN